MRILHRSAASASSAVAATVFILFLGSPSPAAAKGGKGSWNCEALAEGGVPFKFHELKGLHEVSSIEDKGGINSTWQINPCGPIQYPKGTDQAMRCDHGTQICRLEHELTDDGFTKIMPLSIVKDNVDTKFTRLKGSDSSADADKEGVRVVLEGTKIKKRSQRTVIEFLCDREREGTEGPESEDDSDDKSDTERTRKREEQEDGDDNNDKDDDEDKDGDEGSDKPKEPQGDASLRFIAYEAKDDTDVLRLEWRTRHACEDGGKGDGEDQTKGSHWGFFTWFIIILFLGVATYLIFGSWLNYNRYGARGWDLLPHGDTIRDLPYLLKDWIRRVIGTLQGRGGAGRGGYSAV